MSENPKQWRNMEIDCPICGSNPVSIYTKSDKDNFGYEHEEMQCSECGAKGYWSEGTLVWEMEVPNEEILTVFYEKNEALKAKVAELGELLNKQLQYNDFMTSNMINALKFENARMREMVRRIDDDAEETIIDSYKRTEKQAHNDLRKFAQAIRQRCEHLLKGGE